MSGNRMNFFYESGDKSYFKEDGDVEDFYCSYNFFIIEFKGFIDRLKEWWV